MSRLILAILAALTMVTPALAVVLVQDGQARAHILVPQDASATVQFAAQELARYLELISGATVPIAQQGAQQATGVGIIVAPAELPEEETIAISVADAGVRISGGCDRAVVFAVYRFLEELGCRWLAPDQEFVPHKPTLELPALELTSAPQFNMRLFVARREDRRQWGMKMGMNGLYTAADADLHGHGYYLPDVAPECHAYHRIIPADTYFQAHPDWFPLINGQRRPGGLNEGQLCVTAPGLADEFARRVIEILDADPHLKMMSISPNDGVNWCECEQCLALDDRLSGGRTTKQGLGLERRFVGDRVFWFANQVAERVAQVHPDRLLLVLAYVNYAEPPDSVVPAPNIIPWLCHYAPADYSRPIADPTSEPNAQFNDLLLRWSKLAPRLLFYSYVSKSMWWRLPRPVTHTFAADVKYLYSLGIRRYYCQSALTDWAEAGPLYYVICKLLWDPTQDPDALAADWIEHMFGPAAAEMTAFYAAVEDSIKESRKPFSDNPPRDVPGLYNHEDLARARQHLDAALAAAAQDEVALARVRKVEELFRYGEYMIAALETAQQFTQTPTVELAEKTQELATKALQIYRYPYAARYFDSIKMQGDFGVVAQGFGDRETKGGRDCWNSDETGPGDGKAGWAHFFITVRDTDHPVRLEMDVWGKSELTHIVVNTSGDRKSTAGGGVWNAVSPEQPLSGEERWETLVFTIPADLLAPGQTTQTIGFGGGDSQIWVAGIRYEQGQ